MAGNERIARELKISRKLIAMLQNLLNTSDRVFGDIGYGVIMHCLRKQRKRVAKKLQNPRIQRITCHTLRHWKASIEYHRGAKLLEIKQMLGHTSIKSTIVYTHLIEPTESDKYISRATRSVAGARALIEAGFQYVCEMDGLKLFRKRK